MARVSRRKRYFIVFCIVTSLFISADSFAETSSKPGTSPKPGTEGTVGGGGTVTPDLFTGTMSYSIPIEVPAGRHGMQPNLALTYSSNNGNGWVGVGWDLEIGAIERSTRKGINYISGDDYILRTDGSAIDLVNVNGEYRAKIEGGFTRLKKLTAADGKSYWEATDRSGIKYLYGQTSASRQEHPLDGSKIFKWCLDRVEDTNGNYMTISYVEDQGQIYPDRINYAGNTGLSSTNFVQFYWERRNDGPPMYGTNFKVSTTARLKTIYVAGNGNPVRSYKLNYQDSSTTQRSLLTSVQQFGDDVQLDQNGTVVSGSSLSAISLASLQPSAGFGEAATGSWPSWGERYYPGDFNGDGIVDLYIISAGGGWHLYQSTGTGFVDLTSGGWPSTGEHIYTGDFTGDGKTDLYVISAAGGWYLYQSTGTGFAQVGSGNWPSTGEHIYPGDFTGDGKTDLYVISAGGGWYLYQSTGTGFAQVGSGNWPSTGEHIYLGDFTGDGKTDLYVISAGGGWYLYKSTGSGFTQVSTGSWPSTGEHIYPGDFNGDGKSDLFVISAGGGWYLYLSTGVGLMYVSNGGWPSTGERIYTGDFNGDGKADLYFISAGGGWYQYQSTGIGFTYVSSGSWPSTGEMIYTGDFSGNGKEDLLITGQYCNCWTGWKLLVSSAGSPDLLSSIENEFGGSISISYLPSTKYTNTQLPFPVQTVSSVTVSDGNGKSATTTYDYDYGFYHIGERDFRGFNYVKVTGQAGPNGEKTIAETRFHQGDDTAVDVNNPYVTEGYMKGKPYRTKVTDGANNYSETTTSYAADTGGAPYFNPPQQIDTWNYEGRGGSGRHTKRGFTYNSTYGYVTREDHFNDVDEPDDDRTVIRSYSPNATSWIIDRPSKESILSKGTTTLSSTDYYYDQISDCNTASTNQTPTKGNVTRIVRWFDKGASPEVRMAYDNYGNLICTRDPKGNIATLSYDSTYSFLKNATNPLGHVTTTQYYGVDGVQADNGLYGQVKSVTDPNLAVTIYEYDAFGRKKKVTPPIGESTTWTYNNFGTVGSQHVKVDAPAGLWSETYFDGLGRTTKTSKIGSDSKVVAAKTEYNASGTVSKTSLPYFESTETARYTTFTYDPMGRVLTTTAPDNTVAKACYDVGVIVALDANGHRKREARDALGRLVKVEEYQGEYSSCTTESGTVYATTTYEYDVVGNLLSVTDTFGNQTRMAYDSLGQKISMSDPDMGDWTYEYDASGNLTKQTDAQLQPISFTYDALNRVTLKDYPTGTDVVYSYDDPAVANSKGRITMMTDASGTSKYSSYDKLGRVLKVEKTVEGATHTTQTAYDTAGRVSTITYPDSDVVNYSYDTGGLLATVSGPTGTYVSYNNSYNALGQPKTMTYGNNVVTNYDYRSDNNRLWKINVGSNGTLMNLTYGYDNVGNITGITDANDASHSQTFIYDDLNRLYQAQSNSYGALFYSYDEIGNILNKEGISYTYGTKPHAVTATSDGKAYIYDTNGNMISDGTRTISYDYDNKPSSVEAGSMTSFVYDGTGARVKKISGSNTIIYIGKLYECSGGSCAKYIFAGDTRIANKSGTDVLYYHQDHLGSNRLVTNSTGTKVEEIHYYPFGAAQSDTGSLSVNHKYTSKEYDTETCLYYYNARYYNPVLGRFISPDTMVPNPGDPQALNRYSYVGNNPIGYTDPTGHWRVGKWFKKYEGVLITAAFSAAGMPIIGATLASGIEAGRAGGDFSDIVKSAAIGGVTAAVGAGVGYGLGGANVFARGAIAGMAAGGTGAALTGGNVGRAMLAGGASGGLTAGMGLTTNPILRVGGGALIGGTVSSMAGGKFADGAGAGAISAAAGTMADKLARGEELARTSDRETRNKIIAGVFPDGADGSAANAYKHARWNNLIANEPGMDSFDALVVSTAHEMLGNHNKFVFSQGWANFSMDMHNNYIGAFYGTAVVPAYSGWYRTINPPYQGAYP